MSLEGTILSVVGARPQFVKAAPVSARLRERFEEVLVHTGQHYDPELSAVFFEQLGIPDPDHHLGVGSGSHAEQTAAILRGVDALIESVEPDVVLVYGDTNSTLAGALAAAKRDVVLAHVEAGLRSGVWSMPEEVNRVLTDHAADLHFAPSERAARTLRAEGIRTGVHVVGDVMYDALRAVRDRIEAVDVGSIEGSVGPGEVSDEAGESSDDGLGDGGLADGAYILATVHRAANTDDPERLEAILRGLAAVPYPVVLPAHPRTVEAIERHGLAEFAADALTLTDPLGYLEFLGLLAGARAVATDSGGVQKEAFYLDVPCVTMRGETEWVETVEAGWNTLVDADAAAIETALEAPTAPADKPALYGDGTAAAGVVDVIARTIAGEQEGSRVPATDGGGDEP